MHTTRIALVRHGETDWNRETRLQGWTDIPLNPTGQHQAAALAQALADVPLRAIVSSPLSRARDTARAVAAQQGLPVQLDERLRERNLGLLQGLTRAEVATHHPELAHALDARRVDYLPPEGETFAELSGRCWAALQDLVHGHAGATLLLVAHGGVIDAIHRRISGTADSVSRTQHLANATLNWLRHDPQGWHLEQFGLAHHLETPQNQRDDIGA